MAMLTLCLVWMTCETCRHSGQAVEVLGDENLQWQVANPTLQPLQVIEKVISDGKHIGYCLAGGVPDPEMKTCENQGV